jgi:hypothetical protein
MTGMPDGGLHPQQPLDERDMRILSVIGAVYATADPAPDFVDRVLFAADLERIGAELAEISDELVGSYGSRDMEATRTISFDSNSLRVTIVVPDTGSERHLDGWIEPAAALRIELVTPEGRVETRSDERGRFAFGGFVAGQVRLEIHPTPGSAVHLDRPVVTKPVVL